MIANTEKMMHETERIVACTKDGLPQSQALHLVRLFPCYRRHRTKHYQGHENMGIVEELGEGVTLLKKGDRVVMPFNVADGRCRNCEEGKTAFCTGVNPGFAGGAYGELREWSEL